MTTYEHLVDATLPHGLMPLVVPELKTITLGGAITGPGHRELVVSQRDAARVGAGDGHPHRRRAGGHGQPDGEHADLFFGFPNSYGTLGYALRARIELEPVRPYVHLRHVPFRELRATSSRPWRRSAPTRSYEGEAVDFVDGTVFSPTSAT